MKTRFLVSIGLIGILLLATSCLPAVSWETNTPTPIPANWISEAGNRISDLQSAFSPDGKWLATVLKQASGDMLRITSSTDPNRILSSPFSGNLRLISWAPDSLSVLTASYNLFDPSPCHFRNIVIYNLTNNEKALTPIQFEPANNNNENCLVAAWSADSKKLATTFDYREIYILDVNGQVLQKIGPQTRKNIEITEFQWSDSALIYRFSNYEDPANSQYELGSVINNTKNVYSQIFGPIDYVDILSTNADFAEILMSIASIEEHDKGSIHLKVLNTKHKHVIFDQVINGRICTSADAFGNEYTALQITEPGELCGGITYLWVYDWQRRELIKLFPIAALLGWRNNPQGFAVASGTYTNGFEMNIVSPKK